MKRFHIWTMLASIAFGTGGLFLIKVSLDWLNQTGNPYMLMASISAADQFKIVSILSIGLFVVWTASTSFANGMCDCFVEIVRTIVRRIRKAKAHKKLIASARPISQYPAGSISAQRGHHSIGNDPSTHRLLGHNNSD